MVLYNESIYVYARQHKKIEILRVCGVSEILLSYLNLIHMKVFCKKWTFCFYIGIDWVMNECETGSSTLRM